MLLGILEFIVSVLIFVGMLTQVIIPIWQNTILFPSFRSKTSKLEKKRAEAKDDLTAVEAEAEIDHLVQQADKKRKPKQES